ncbi:MAG: agmatinase [Chloroflexi bacterium]|nr:agmatinase [Chloroflexota bacterium]
MSDSGGIPEIPYNFLSLPYEQSRLDLARAVLIPVPYDSTTSFRSGARDGPNAMILASNGLEDYDAELDLDVSLVGINTTAALEPHMGGPEHMAQRVRSAVARYLAMGKLVGVMGGEHSLAAGAVQAHADVYPDLSVLYLDAHADLRDEYMGTCWGHASGARRIHDVCPLVLVGLRSMSQEESDYIRVNAVPAFTWPSGLDHAAFNRGVIDLLSPRVYISIDLDVLDPALMPAVGTPEPGGMGWDQLTGLLKEVARSRRIVGFDVCELSPGDGPPACSYTAAKLVYKLVAYATAFSD